MSRTHRLSVRAVRPTRRASDAPYSRLLRVESLEDRRMLAGVVVGNNLDVVNGTTTSIAALIATPGGDGISLREAVLAANATPNSPGGVADVITFAAGLSGQTISLSGQEFQITEALTIDARPLAENVTINGNQASRIVNITALTGDFALAGLTLTGGRTTEELAGGGAVSSATAGLLMVIESTVSGNMTTGDSAYGGGIRCFGDLTVTHSTVSDNQTTGGFADGGGMFCVGTLTLAQSTVSGNSTAGSQAEGGGMTVFGSVTLNRSTISGNGTANVGGEGGGIYVTGAVSLTGTTITNNNALVSAGGGVWQRESSGVNPFSISGSIVAGNLSGAGGADLFKASNATLTVNYSLIGTSVVPDAGGNNVATDDPQLAPLADNGGPTETHAVLATSPARNAGDPTVVANPAQFDQRGAPFLRVANGRIDIGAYERQTLAGPLVVDTATDVEDGDFSTGQLSLREAIDLANGSIGAETISIATSLSGQTILLSGRELTIREALTIDARPLTANVTIDANRRSRIFTILTGDVTLAGLTMTGGRTTGNEEDGGAIRSFSSEMLMLNESTVTGNSTVGNFAEGGGIFALSDVTLIRSTVSDNSTAAIGSSGGGVFSSHSVTLRHCTVSGNSQFGNFTAGGGVFALNGATVTDSTISGNFSVGGGGGIWAAFGPLLIERSTITNNDTDGTGGGVLHPDTENNASVIITHTILAGNTADGDGADLQQADPQSSLSFAFSAVGEIFFFTASDVGSISTNNPQLGPLADNGGPTRTHVPLAGSPVIDAGDPAVAFNPAEFDQRGAPFVRVANGRIDIGAVERQTADFDGDNDVDGFDFLAWQRGFGSTSAAATFANGNADGDIDVDGDDLAVWKAQFGSAAPAGSSSLEAGDSPSVSPQAVDAALAWQMAAEAPASRPLFRPRLLRAR